LQLNKTPAAAEAVHRSLLAGLLSHIGMKDVEKRDYLGARGTRFAIFPGSALAKKQPPFVMSAELVETSRLWGRVNASIEPEWAESLAAHLVRRSYSEPHWEKKRGAVMAIEKVTLYGVPIVSDRKVNYGRIDRETARALFIRHALVQGEWETHHRFFQANQATLAEAEELEQRARRRGIVVDNETLFDFYDERVGPEVISVAHFDSWWKQQRRADPELLTFSIDMIVQPSADEVSLEEFPDVWRQGDAELPLRYEFAPGADSDGVTVQIPVTSLHTVQADHFSWPVPGQRQDLVVALIRSLPKALRVNFVPAPNHAKAFLDATTPGEEPLVAALERYLRRTTGIVVQRDDWNLDKVPAHLRPSFSVLSPTGEELGRGRDLDVLKRALRSDAEEAISSAASAVERSGLTTWEVGTLPHTYTQTLAGHAVQGYPALVDEGPTVGVKVFGTAAEQADAMRRGERRLLVLTVPSPAPGMVKDLSNADKLALGLNPHGSVRALLDDCFAAAVDVVVAEAGGPAWDEAGFSALQASVSRRASDLVRDVVSLVRDALLAGYEIDRRLSGRADLARLAALTDLKAQWARLVYPGFVSDAGLAALRSYPRYFAAMGERLDRLATDPHRDAAAMASMAGVLAAYQHAVSALPPGAQPSEPLRAVRWMLEELRVSLWAQRLGTPRPISVQRVERALRDI
ncbi:MAG: ATP-dependent helicase HrpA, partial [Nocardioidaceae bacterium]|nr:ATP-dependent helicase HrpA [Nocardioidaceae bacterium]